MDISSLLPMFGNILSKFSNTQSENNTNQNQNIITNSMLGYPDTFLTDNLSNIHNSITNKNNYNQNIQNQNYQNNLSQQTQINSTNQTATQNNTNPLFSLLENFLGGNNTSFANLQNLTSILGNNGAKNGANDLLSSFLNSTTNKTDKKEKDTKKSSFIQNIKKIDDVDLSNINNV